MLQGLALVGSLDHWAGSAHSPGLGLGVLSMLTHRRWGRNQAKPRTLVAPRAQVEQEGHGQRARGGAKHRLCVPHKKGMVCRGGVHDWLECI